MPSDRQPERTCIGCRQKASKTELIRLVRNPSGEILVDPSVSAAGRGAYVHPGGICIATAVRTRSVNRALRTQISADRAGSLIEEVTKARSPE